MKKLFILMFVIVVSGQFSKLSAQSDERRNNVQLVITFEGNTLKADLNSLSTSISRTGYEDLSPLKSTADTSKTKAKLPPGSYPAFYLTMDIKQVDTELMKVFAKKQSYFDGTVTITDTYGKNPTRVVKFKQASLYSYSDQFSAASYGDYYGNSVISITCKEVSINGVNIE
ncbi:type VI secretion system tube protein TssD [Pedobacter rhodius]|uniref:Type VI secretion system tube protein TssD n=1 Tax=Pedobacter rhodius TaxID=3004098 RepID=A0ABT4KSG8_9SPHI|nr:type VI secretion system tube protein TssD [Pedobacter sp. SJ11]MCZ4221873.1 type VI secretion system tube protein TssD [Pedobacter sp. SJ11]